MLCNPSGEPCTNRREAEAAKEIAMQPFALGDEAKVLESLAEKLTGKRAELARLEKTSAPKIKVADAWSAFAQSVTRPDCGATTLQKYRGMWLRFTAWLGEHHAEAQHLAEVTPAMAQAYCTFMLETRRSAPGTFNAALRLLRAIFRTLKAQIGGPDPWEGIRSRTMVTNSRSELTIEELRTVCTTATGEMQVLLAIGLFTGLRLKDCCTLRWSEVDLSRKIITRVPAKTARRKPRPVIIPIHPSLGEALSKLPQGGDYVLPGMARAYQNTHSGLTRTITSHFQKCGVQTTAPGTGEGTNKRAVPIKGFHSLRHSFISICKLANIPQAVVASIVGHHSLEVTSRYTHVGEAAAAEAVRSLPDVLLDAPLVLPPAPRPLGQVKHLLSEMTPKNWKEMKSKILELLE
jgi:integrase